jgi:serine/threonine protein kinase
MRAMASAKSSVGQRTLRVESFDLQPGRLLAGKYVVEGRLGGGWEGEVYKVTERRTGASRAAKVFFPQRNQSERAVTFYARKLEHLRACPLVIKYHHSESFRFRGHPMTVLISEYVDGVLLDDLVAAQPGKRLHPYEAMHLLHALASGVEQIHRMRDYHGDLHSGNVLVQRRGVQFDVKLVDLYDLGRPTKANIQEDVFDLVRIFYDVVGGRKWYATQPVEVKSICRGLRRGPIAKAFPTARQLREHLEEFPWSSLSISPPRRSGRR